MNFSLLMSVYHKEKPHYLDSALESVWVGQSVKPDEIVLVEDGPLTNELYNVVKRWKNRLGERLIVVSLERNVGLGRALNEGLLYCRNDIVARMDADDISMSDRFEKQIGIMRDSLDIDICGSWVSEFETDENNIISYRKVPEKHEDILKFSKSRNPMNHPSVMFRKKSVLAVDGYKDMPWFEDYYLWVRMIINGAKLYNLQEPLVKMRVGDGQIGRRSGILYAKSEINMQRELLRLGFIGKRRFVSNIFLRISVRVLPLRLAKSVYLIIRKI